MLSRSTTPILKTTDVTGGVLAGWRFVSFNDDIAVCRFVIKIAEINFNHFAPVLRGLMKCAMMIVVI